MARAAHDDRVAPKLGTPEELAGDEEGVHVDVQDHPFSPFAPVVAFARLGVLVVGRHLITLARAGGVAHDLRVHPNAVAVAMAAEERGLQIETREYPDGTKTADDAARAIGVTVGQIVKSLVFMVAGRPVLALVSGVNRLDETKLARQAGMAGLAGLVGEGGSVVRADADQVRAATGYPIGGVPPFGHPSPLPTFVDEDLLGHDVLWAAAGTPRDNFAIAPDDLVRVTRGTVGDLRLT